MGLSKVLKWCLEKYGPVPNSMATTTHALNPRHIAIIMDGNGRWAVKKGLPRIMGHRAGLESVRAAITACVNRRIEVLTLYAFSYENWKRPKPEVTELMSLLEIYLQHEMPMLQKKNVRLHVMGRVSLLPKSAQRALAQAIEATSRNTGLVLNLALSYGSRAEIVDAVREIVEHVQKKRYRVGQITERLIAKHLYTSGLPDPDLLIRTSGEMRLSNFMLWQLSYTELYVTDTLWPDFRSRHLSAAIAAYRRRERRFGR